MTYQVRSLMIKQSRLSITRLKENKVVEKRRQNKYQANLNIDEHRLYIGAAGHENLMAKPKAGHVL